MSNHLERMLKHIPSEEIAPSQDLLDGPQLQGHLESSAEPRLGLLAAGDIMLGGRARSALKKHGPDYPFQAILPLLQRADVVLGNLEGPLARKAERQDRTFSYRVAPSTADALARAGIRVVTLANNHLVDCGRSGVIETLEALEAAGVAPIGAGRTVNEAHQPAIVQASGCRVGLLGYYWNRRCAATETLPGSAMDGPDLLAADITALRRRVDRVVATFHWGVPYEREPSAEDRAKARLAIDLGADAVIGHHPHVIQPFEVYRSRPIFYSVGNFIFGSGNSRGEGLAVGLRFDSSSTHVSVYPLYVKNRDPRVQYQPKALRGEAARRVMTKLVAASGESGRLLRLRETGGTLVLPRAGAGDRCPS